jgi:serine phosphatase RsbU (regulator of sigma subunit)
MAAHKPATFCTVCFVLASERSDGGLDLVMSLGGHPQPIVSRADGGVELVGEPGTLLGLVEPRLSDAELILHPGDTLLLYTDGLTDAPGTEAVTLAEIESLLADDPLSHVDDIANRLRSLKRNRRPAGSGDDTVVVLLRVGELPALVAAAGAN